MDKKKIDKKTADKKTNSFDHEAFRKQLVYLHKPDINKKHIEKAATEIEKKFTPHFNGAVKGRAVKEMTKEEKSVNVLNIIKEHARKKIAEAVYVKTPVAMSHFKEEVEQVDEAVTVKKTTHPWGKMMVVHHGASHSFPLHPEHQEAIANLKDGENTSFTDETKSKVTAHRDGDTVHLSLRGSNTKTPVAMSHFKEEVELDEAKRGRPRKDGSKPAGDDEHQEADQNIHTQLHKVISANKPVTFNSGEKKAITPQHAHKALSMLQNAKASDRLAIQNSLAHSHDRFHQTIKTGKAVIDAARPRVSLGKMKAESVDPSTVRADKGAIVVRSVRKPDGSYVLTKTHKGRGHLGDIIDTKEAVTMYDPKKSEEAEEKKEGQGSVRGNSADMTSDSRDRMSSLSPQAFKQKFKLPLTVGNKSSGGEDTSYSAGKISVAEEKILNSIYEDLSEENKEFFNNLMQTEDGKEKLLHFANQQGY